MTYKDECCMCRILAGGRRYKGADDPFMESENYLAIPSIGSFIEGWSMIIPKEHRLSMEHDYGNQEFLGFVSDVRSHVEAAYGKTIMFEHGAKTVGSATGCGVDHAHLHIVPFSHSLKPALNDSDLVWNECSGSDICLNSTDKDYLFYCEDQHIEKMIGFLHVLDEPRSQFFRQLIAKNTGNEMICNYKLHPLLDSAKRTNERLSA